MKILNVSRPLLVTGWEMSQSRYEHFIVTSMLRLTQLVQIRERLNRDHQIAGFLSRIQDQSKRLLEIYNDTEGRTREIQAISTGDPFDEFYKQLGEIKDFHRRYPNEPVENLERAYKRKAPAEGESSTAEVDNLFTGEEAWGKFLDLTTLHEDYLNLHGVKRLTYLQYLDSFDIFVPPQNPIKRADKCTDQYFTYLKNLVAYLEDFLRRTRPLDDLDKFFANFDADFEKAWESNSVPGWTDEKTVGPSAPKTEGTGEGIWCPDCEKEFKNDNVYKAHLTGKKHIKAAEIRKASLDKSETNGHDVKPKINQVNRLKERAIAEREFRIAKLASTLSSERVGTKVNIERKQGMTERERQQELDALFAESADNAPVAHDSDSDSDSSEKIYNPLKLPLAWDGKPIPYWLYKLHGLGVELPCEICGNFVYMGRRAFDKHFNEARHIYGLKCLGITSTSLFREITGIEDALKLWDKIQRDKKLESNKGEGIVQMEDAEGNVMPEKVYYEYVYSFPTCQDFGLLTMKQFAKARSTITLVS
jgi:splicing factor 3A subunit 3